MDISEQQVGRVWVVTARGRLDGTTSGTFAQRLDVLVAREEPRLLVDFSGVGFVSSAGLRAVLALVKKIKSANGVFALCALQAPVQEVLEITGFTGMIAVYSDRASALSALS